MSSLSTWAFKATKYLLAAKSDVSMSVTWSNSFLVAYFTSQILLWLYF